MMSKARSLAATQQHFANALLHVDAVTDALPLFATNIDSAMTRNRVALYRGNLTAIWQQALSNAYPVMLQLVGEDYFVQLSRAYGHAHPSEAGDLNEFGTYLADFLVSSGAADDYPYFPDVARLEWLLHRAYYAKDAEPLTLPQLIVKAQESGSELQRATLALCPSTYLMQSPYASVGIWLAHQVAAHEMTGDQTHSATWPDRIDQASFAVVTRQHWQATAHTLSEASFKAVQALSNGKTLGQAFEVALALDPQFDVAGQLQVWFAAQMFSGADFGSTL